jgi:hypothetical protein
MLRRLHHLGLLCAALLSTLLLSSCLEEYNEEMEIRPDLSGTATVTVKLPDTLLDKYDKVQEEFKEANIRKRFAKVSGVKLDDYNVTEGRHPVATFTVSFSSLEKLSEAAKQNAPAQMLVGEWIVSKDGENTVVERRLGRGTATMSLPADKNALYKLHFDMPVEVMHTDSGLYDKSHGDLRYRWTMANIESDQPSMINKVIKPLPWLWIGLSIAVLVVIAWYAWKYFENLKRRPKPLPPEPAPAPPIARAQPGSAVPPQGPPQRPAGPQRPMPPRPGPPRKPGQ